MAEPFLRWAGSKRRLLHKIQPALPVRYGRYIEPFLGGGSLFFSLQPQTAYLSDLNESLVETYIAVRDDVEKVIGSMEQFRYEETHYYWIRDEFRPTDRWEIAARFVALNKMCWNGLYRVNAKGKFNVPFGSLGCPNFLDRAQLRAASRALRGVSLACQDFETALAQVKSGDFVFLDPPYATSHIHNGFVAYNATIFDWEDQRRLAAECRRIHRLGAAFVMTNGAHESIEDLYRGFEIRRFRRPSTIANDPENRRRTEETLIVGRQPRDE